MKKSTEIDTLLFQARSGDAKAEDRLFGILRDSFRMFAQQRFRNADDCEDMVQNALVTVAQKYRSLDVHTSFSAWAWQVMKYKMMDHIKVEKARQLRTETLDETVRDDSWPGADHLLRLRMLECLNEVGRASTQFARVLNLHYQGYGTDEICRRLTLKADYLYVLLSRARAMLLRCMEREKD